MPVLFDVSAHQPFHYDSEDGGCLTPPVKIEGNATFARGEHGKMTARDAWAQQTLLMKRSELIKAPVERPMVERHADSLDQALADENTRRIAEDRTRDAGLLRQINAALESIEAGEYGTCQRCDRLIAEKRLAAVPWALMCVRCQETVDAQERSAR